MARKLAISNFAVTNNSFVKVLNLTIHCPQQRSQNENTINLTIQQDAQYQTLVIMVAILNSFPTLTLLIDQVQHAQFQLNLYHKAK
jgi:hypothetical protein